MSNLIEIESNDEINELKTSNNYVVIDFFATTCIPCRRIKPFVDHLSKVNKDNIKFCLVDVNDNPEIKEEYGIEKIPTFIFIKNGELVDKYVGHNLDEIKNTLNKHKDIRQNEDF